MGRTVVIFAAGSRGDLQPCVDGDAALLEAWRAVVAF